MHLPPLAHGTTNSPGTALSTASWKSSWHTQVVLHVHTTYKGGAQITMPIL